MTVPEGAAVQLFDLRGFQPRALGASDLVAWRLTNSARGAGKVRIRVASGRRPLHTCRPFKGVEPSTGDFYWRFAS